MSTHDTGNAPKQAAAHDTETAPDQKPITIGYRRFAHGLVGNLKSPRLRGIQVDGRLAVWVGSAT